MEDHITNYATILIANGHFCCAPTSNFRSCWSTRPANNTPNLHL